MALKRLGKKLFSTSSYPTEPLSKSIEIANQPVAYSKVESIGSNPTHVTRLSNGLRVSSQAAFGQYCTVGVFVDAGSRYEVEYTSGVTHILSKLAFQSSPNYNTSGEIAQALEQYGGLPDVQVFRDIVFYSVSAVSCALPDVLAILADVLWRPQLRQDELETCQQAIPFELESHLSKVLPDTMLFELIQQAGYNGNTLGLPCLSIAETINNITIPEIKTYLASHYVPSRMVLAGVNIDHQQLVELGEKYFIDPRTSWEGAETKPVDQSLAQYTGGEKMLPRKGALVIGPNQVPDLTHVAIGFESCSYREKDFFAFAVLNSLMGGGGSFSAGGPGKGMYTRLYSNVLNKHHWIYHAQAINHAYSDSGLFCLYGSANPSQSKNLVGILCEQFHEMTKTPNPVDVARAKQQLQSTLMMNLESRVINFEDMGRQIMAHGKRETGEELCRKIEEVTPEDLSRISKRMYEQSPPSFAALGNLDHVPSVKDVEKLITGNYATKLTNRFYKMS